MNTLIIYASRHKGNTEKVARAMAEAAGCEAIPLERARGMDLSVYDALGFGSGIYFGKHDKQLLEFAEGLPQLDKNVFLFSTRGAKKLGKYHDALSELLERKGSEILGHYSCNGYDCYGPFKLVGGINRRHPDEADLAGAREFISEIGLQSD